MKKPSRFLLVKGYRSDFMRIPVLIVWKQPSSKRCLVLIVDNKEVIEEGIGFGVPVIKFKDKTYFSSSAKVSLIRNPGSALSLKKTFFLDSVSRKRFWRTGYINDGLYSQFHKSFERLYLSHKSLSSLFNKMMEFRELPRSIPILKKSSLRDG